MTEISRRSFFATTAGAGGMLLAGTVPTVATAAGDGSCGVRALCQGRSWTAKLGYFYCLEIQRADGSWKTLHRPWVRLALLAQPLNGPALEPPHVRVGERVTFRGRAPLQPNAGAWHTTSIVNCRGEPLAFATTLETWKRVHARVDTARNQARAEGLDHAAVREAVAAAVEARAA